MASLTPDQQRTRDRFELLIRVMEPGLNLVLAVGERISRVAQREDVDYHPARPPGLDLHPRAGLATGRETPGDER
jgi:hypothetical protein